MLSLFVLITLLANVQCSCPNSFQLIRDGECRGYYTWTNIYQNEAVNEATLRCSEINGKPVIIHGSEQQTYWTTQQPTQGDYYMVIGLVCNATSKKWQWSDRSVLDFKPPHYEEALDGECWTDCSWFLDKNGKWFTSCGSSDYDGVNFFCTTQLTQPVASTDCGNFIDGSDETHCYEIATGAEDWQDAQTICHSFGAELASVHNQDQNSYIRRLAVSRGALNGVLLGATVSGKSNDFAWIDGTDWDYTNFHPGFPLDGFGYCLTMDTITTAGQWMNTDCSSKLPVICSRPYHDTPELSGCTSGPWKEGQIIYSPGFPNDASIPCEYFLSGPTGSRVELTIELLEANSCCDFLMITDGYVGGTIIANLTGEISNERYYTSSSNIMRVIWQPSGGVNVRGLMMSFTTY